ncbi:Tyrosine-specific transport protein [invertebrate metagenome]|uniref:Tyrosine-specific transport protein n=1 Tax=invertebrate metagenome TaxID=1711999 RepID=A0A2H9T7Q6_9ZZZZ
MRNKTLGGTLIIAGTSIGAGMLTLPLVLSSVGFLTGVCLMILIWGLAAYSGLLIAEACCACPQAKTLHNMAGMLLGRQGQTVAVGAMLFLFYALCAAYISGGAAQLQDVLAKWNIFLSSRQAACSVTLMIGFVLWVGTAMVDYANRLLFMLMLLFLLLILMALLPEIKLDYLLTVNSHPSLWLAALPILYTSFGYQGSVPSVVSYLNREPYYFRKALIFGSAIPLAVYLLWQLAVSGVLPPVVMTSTGSVGGMIDSLGYLSASVWMEGAVNSFAILALVTSFLGVSLGLFDYLAEVCQRKNGGLGRFQSVCMTLLPPLVIAVFSPDSFITALGYAAIALVILAIYLPAAMVWKVRKQKKHQNYRVAGGLLAIVISISLGSLIVVAQLGVVTGYLSSVG